MYFTRYSSRPANVIAWAEAALLARDTRFYAARSGKKILVQCDCGRPLDLVGERRHHAEYATVEVFRCPVGHLRTFFRRGAKHPVWINATERYVERVRAEILAEAGLA